MAFFKLVLLENQHFFSFLNNFSELESTSQATKDYCLVGRSSCYLVFRQQIRIQREPARRGEEEIER